MGYVREISFLLLFGRASYLSDTILSDQPPSEINLGRLECKLNCSRDILNAASNGSHISWESYLKFRSPKATSVTGRRVVDHILLDGDIVGEMHLDVKKVNTESQGPLQIKTDTETGLISGYFFNFHDHKPTFKLDTKDQARVSLTGGLLNATYMMDQFHFHVYCTRTEAEENTLDRAQVPGELHLVFFREKYQSYSKAVHRFQDGLVVVSFYLEVGEDECNSHQIAKFSSLVDYISQDENRKVSTTASVKQLTAPLENKHAQYDAYRGNLVEPVQCKECVDVFVMKERFAISVKQMTEFRKAPHCVENDWTF